MYRKFGKKDGDSLKRLDIFNKTFAHCDDKKVPEGVTNLLACIPERGTAIVTRNASPDAEEDSRSFGRDRLTIAMRFGTVGIP